jgi:hypothetical protein
LLDYVAKADLQYTYENGMRIINLPEVEVKGIKRDQLKYKSPFYSFPDHSFSAEEVTEHGSIEMLLYMVPGVRVVSGMNGYNIQIRGASSFEEGIKSPLIIIDDVVMMPMGGESVGELLERININDIGQLDVLKSSNAIMYGSGATNGAIVIHTKKGEGISDLPAYNIQTLRPLGYQAPVEFYSPKYDTKEKLENQQPDLRTTIYWQPNVLTDEEGKAKLNFYTADDPATYSVIIEGVSVDGRLIHYRGNGLIRVVE